MKWRLKRHPLFEALSNEEIGALLARARPVTHRARAHIFSQGDASDSLYIIVSGRLKISANSQAGKEIVLAFAGENEVIGEMGVFGNAPRSATASALEETRTLQIDKADFVAFIEHNPGVAVKMIASLAARLRQTNEQFEDAATRGADARLARALLRLADKYGKPQNDGGVLIDLKLSQSAIGAHAGMMRESVNRQLKAWEGEGLITVQKGWITLREIEKLRAIALE